jgi:hypothetical protein
MENKIQINQAELGLEFCRFINQDEDYQKIEKIALNNAREGGIWLIGGYVYKNLIKIIHGTNGHKQPKDYDFLVEQPNEKIKLPFGWRFRKNIFGSPKFINFLNFGSIDFVPLGNYCLEHGNKEKSLDSYLTSVPLNVQSIAYDLIKHKFEGAIGLNAVKERKLSVNNPQSLIDYIARRKHTAVEKYLVKTAKALNFDLDDSCRDFFSREINYILNRDNLVKAKR